MNMRWAANLGRGLIVSIAIYPIMMVMVWALFALGNFAAATHLATDAAPLAYALVFAALTVALVDILGVGTAVMGLVALANLIEYAQLMIPGRSASAVDFVAGLSGVLVGAVLVWAARSLLVRIRSMKTATEAVAVPSGRT